MGPAARPSDTAVLLIHGGLWEDAMDARRFWVTPGVVAGLTAAGLSVTAPDRLRRPQSWIAEAEYLAPHLRRKAPAVLVAGSNGCSVAVRLAVAFPELVAKLVLAWPATAGDPEVDARTRSGLSTLGASPEIVETLLACETLRGVTDAEVEALPMPVAVLPAAPENPFHRRHTVDAIRRLLPKAEELPGCTEPPRPDFPPQLGAFVGAVAGFVSCLSRRWKRRAEVKSRRLRRASLRAGRVPGRRSGWDARLWPRWKERENPHQSRGC